MRRRCRHSDWNGHFPSSTRTCASTALAPRKPITTVCTVASSAFSRTAAEDNAPYLVPQETGNHEDVRWAEVLDAQGHGMRISQAGSEHFAASLLPYSSLMLEEATHQNELPPVRHTFLRLLAAQMGVGGDDSWGAPVHEQYQLPADRAYTLDVNLELF